MRKQIKNRQKTGGRVKGTPNKMTNDVRQMLVNFLDDKFSEVLELWDDLDNREKISLFLQLAKIVLPKPQPEPPTNAERPIFTGIDLSVKPIEWITGMEIIDSGTPQMTTEQIDKLIDKL